MIRFLAFMLLLIQLFIYKQCQADEYKEHLLKSLYTGCLKYTGDITKCRCVVKEYSKEYNQDDIDAYINGENEKWRAKMTPIWQSCDMNPPPFPDRRKTPVKKPLTHPIL